MKTVKISENTTKIFKARDAETRYVLEEGVTMTNRQLTAINAEGKAAGRIIEIDGTITSPVNPGGGVYIGDYESGRGGGKIVIGQTGSILNQELAVGTSGDHTRIINHGTLDSYGGVCMQADDVSVTNDGTIKSHWGSVLFEGRNGTLHNSGDIQSAGSALAVIGDHVDSNRVVNTGSISGALALQVEATSRADFTIVNRGSMSGDIVFGAGNDVYNGLGGTLNGAIHGGKGNDTYIIDDASVTISEDAGGGHDAVRSRVTYMLGNEIENLVLTGGDDIGGAGNFSANHLTGNIANNTLSGFEGDDRLSGGRGNDLLFGGLDSDTFLFRNGFDADTIVDFQAAGAGHDRIDLRGVDGFDSFADVMAHATSSGTDTVIHFGHGDTLTLENVASADLHGKDFLF